jgi:hypothetical protein
MSGSRKIDTAARVAELQEELSIPVTPLTSRPPAEPSPSLVQPEEAAPEGKGSASFRTPRTRPTAARAPTTSVVEELTSEDEATATLSSRIPKRVRDELDRQVYAQKMKGKKVTFQDVVTTILIRGLGMSEQAEE